MVIGKLENDTEAKRSNMAALEKDFSDKDYRRSIKHSSIFEDYNEAKIKGLSFIFPHQSNNK